MRGVDAGDLGDGDGLRGGWGEVGVGEELGDGETGDGGVFAVGELGEALDAHLGVVLGVDLELLEEKGGAEGAVGFVLGGGDQLFGLVLFEAGGGEEILEFGAGGGEAEVEVLRTED